MHERSVGLSSPEINRPTSGITTWRVTRKNTVFLRLGENVLGCKSPNGEFPAKSAYTITRQLTHEHLDESKPSYSANTGC